MKSLLPEKLIKSLKKEERYTEELVQITKSNISKKEKHVSNLRKQMTKRVVHIYKNGIPSLTETILSSKNWNEIIYRTKYLKVISEFEKKMINEIETTLNDLNFEKESYEKALNKKNHSEMNTKMNQKNLNLIKRKKKFIYLK